MLIECLPHYSPLCISDREEKAKELKIQSVPSKKLIFIRRLN